MNVLFIGDITGSVGRKVVAEHLDSLKKELSVDVTIANVDNVAHGIGITPKTALQVRELGVDVMTGGNHLFDRKEIIPELDEMPWLLRGANYPADVPGRALFTANIGGKKLAVFHLMGGTFMNNYENPFHAFDEFWERHGDSLTWCIVDFHAEATSEKIALGRHIDGRASALVGTHTHVQTADEQVLPGGLAYITDVGMTGPHDGIIGMSTPSVLPRFLTGLPTRFEPAEGNIKLHAVLINLDDDTGRGISIERIIRG